MEFTNHKEADHKSYTEKLLSSWAYRNGLEPWEELRIIRGIGKQFTCVADASKAGAETGKRKNNTLTPTDKAAMMYVIASAPPELKKQFDAGFKILFPDLEPCSTSANGEMFYSSGDIADALGMDRGEANEMVKALIEGEAGSTPTVSPAGRFN